MNLIEKIKAKLNDEQKILDECRHISRLHKTLSARHQMECAANRVNVLEQLLNEINEEK